MRARGEADQRELAVAVEPLGEAVAALQQLAGVGEAAVLVVRARRVLRRQCVALELVELVRQPVDALGDDRRRARARRCARRSRARRARARDDFAARVGVGAERVEQRELLPRIEQRLVFVLAVDLDQAARRAPSAASAWPAGR